MKDENPFSARGAIRRLSLRDRSGMTLARIEAQNENSTLLRSFSKEDVGSHEKFVSVYSLIIAFKTNYSRKTSQTFPEDLNEPHH
jgi:hypothetical protein